MNLLIILIIILIILLIICHIYDVSYNYNYNSTENFKSENILNQDIPKEKNITGDVMKFLDDPLFNDVKLYSNDDTDDPSTQVLGLEKCLDNKNCVCVEFGITGNAFCFPKTS